MRVVICWGRDWIAVGESVWAGRLAGRTGRVAASSCLTHRMAAEATSGFSGFCNSPPDFFDKLSLLQVLNLVIPHAGIHGL